MLGNGRLNCKCTDFVFRNVVIRGKFKKRVWINPGDIILVEKDPFKKERGLVVLKYFPEEVKSLEKMGALVFDKPVEKVGGEDSDSEGWFDQPLEKQPKQQ